MPNIRPLENAREDEMAMLVIEFQRMGRDENLVVPYQIDAAAKQTALMSGTTVSSKKSFA